MMSQIIIDDDNFTDFLNPVIDGEPVGKGLIERDFAIQPHAYGAGAYDAIDMPLIDESEWEPRIKEMEERKTRLSDIRRTGNNGGLIVNLNQGQSNFCWFHSAAHALMLQRAVMGQPFKKLSAFAGACKIKNFRNQGGWSPLAMEFLVKNGIPEDSYWPEGSWDRRNDNSKTWENAKLYQVTEGWWDLSQNIYTRNLTFKQVMTLLLCRVPVTLDLNWWGHSVCGMDPVLVEKGSYGIRILNSWLNWGDKGEAVLRGNKAIPDGAVAPRVVDAAAA